jgi:hypothetical protein
VHAATLDEVIAAQGHIMEISHNSISREETARQLMAVERQAMSDLLAQSVVGHQVARFTMLKATRVAREAVNVLG